jgi:hypothetical protein
MKQFGLLTALITAVLGLMLTAAPASAQATRTWVSGVGDDANPCSRTAPCKTFAGAISKTSSQGEINCLDPGGFGAVTITKPITIDCLAVSNGGVLVSGTNGISVTGLTAGQIVQLIGLDIDGLGPGGSAGLNGVSVSGGGNVSIINCLIYGFASTTSPNGNGVYVATNTAGAHVLIENSIIRGNVDGVQVNPSANASVTIDHSVVESNSTANLVVTNSFATAVLQASTLAGSPTAISNTGGAVISYGNNFIRNAGTPTQTLPLQ